MNQDNQERAGPTFSGTLESIVCSCDFTMISKAKIFINPSADCEICSGKETDKTAFLSSVCFVCELKSNKKKCLTLIPQ